MLIIRQVSGSTELLVAELSTLLQDVVHHGASVGFLAPLELSKARDYWHGTLSDLGPGLALWIAEQEGRVVGSIQLELCQRANGRHRAGVQKLFVLSSHRGQGISSRLMATAEEFARANYRFLLVLDTETGSLAESMYRHWQWQHAGNIPNYASSPEGKLHPTSYYFKQLELEK